MKNFLRMIIASIGGLLGAASIPPVMPQMMESYAAPARHSRYRSVGKPGRAGAKLAKQAGKARVGLRTSAR